MAVSEVEAGDDASMVGGGVIGIRGKLKEVTL